MDRIRIDYQTMYRVAGAFGQQAGEIGDILRALEGRINQLDASWDGIAEQAFRQEWESCRRKLADTPRMLQEIATALTRIADEIRAAEERMRAQMSTIITSDNY
ncbi:MAG: WXG100 family type VII secretion target [Chloroflexi bacterium]|uniref:WXG100 family type VII secretion target n=1 Tax=Candidatus Roseilinea sp. NK_OTU-006 TaxID=2704250 RepID=UPI000F24FB56|nr:WXG100 family type VII secretion target [Candidatus Roseilinea sp. NK_OTU-006]RMG62981.1 MAG: WXG100 family type VII secretion target [Chloroflexota bacterium]